MKKSMSFVLISCLFISMQPVMAMEEAESPAIAQQGAKTSAVLSWFKSLRKPTMEDLKNVKIYLNSKGRCLRYGEGCSIRERAVLVTLTVLVAAAVATLGAVGIKKLKNKRGEEWMRYAEDGDLGGIQRLIDAGIDVNKQDQSRNTALIYAAWNGHPAVVDALIKAGAEINKQNKNDDTALIYAALQGHSAVVDALIKAKADVNLQNADGNTALIYAAWKGHPEIVKILLDNGADVNLQNNNGETASDVIDVTTVEGININRMIRKKREEKEQSGGGV